VLQTAQVLLVPAVDEAGAECREAACGESGIESGGRGGGATR
jgi:hypothetical protein